MFAIYFFAIYMMQLMFCNMFSNITFAIQFLAIYVLQYVFCNRLFAMYVSQYFLGKTLFAINYAPSIFCIIFLAMYIFAIQWTIPRYNLKLDSSRCFVGSLLLFYLADEKVQIQILSTQCQPAIPLVCRILAMSKSHNWDLVLVIPRALSASPWIFGCGFLNCDSLP